MHLKHILRRLLLPLAVLLSGLPAAHADTAKPQAIRIAIPDIGANGRSTGTGISLVLEQQRLLEKEFAADGIEIKWLYFKGVGPEINEAYANGHVDFAYLGDLAAIIGKARGLDTRVVGATLRNIPGYLAVVPGLPISGLNDLKDKRVALAKGTANHLAFNSALRSQGMTEKDVRLVNLDSQAAMAALASRHIDAIWGPSNILTLKTKGLADIAVDAAQLPGGAGKFQAVLLGRGEFIDQYPQVTRRFIKVNDQAAAWLRAPANRAEYTRIFSEISGYPTDVDPLKGQDFAQLFDTILDDGFIRQLQDSVDLTQELRLIRRGFAVEEWIWRP